MRRVAHPRLAVAVLVLLVVVTPAVPALSQTGRTRAPLPVEQWLGGPEHADFPWKVEVLPPRLTFQQRYVVQVRITVPVADLQRGSAQRDLHFLVKAADEQGRWLPGEGYAHQPLPPDFARTTDLVFAAAFYARPGKYVVAASVYDSVLRQRNLWRKELNVPALKDDPLPQLDRNLPAIEFITEVPQEAAASQNLGYPAQAALDALWPLAHGREWLPVSSARPLRIDVVINFSGNEDSELARAPAAASRRLDLGRLLKVASVLAQLQVQNGCLRVSGLDITRMQVVFDGVAGSDVDWDKVSEALAKTGHTVDVGALGSHARTAAFVRDYLMQLLSDPAGCGAGGEPPQRVVVLVSGPLRFPAGSKREHLEPRDVGSCRFYYVRVLAVPVVVPVFAPLPGFGRGSGGRGGRLERPVAADAGDDLEGVFKALKPRRLVFGDPIQFRKALAEMIADF